MWAAANSTSRATSHHPQDSDWDSDSSGERSTTESVIGEKPNDATVTIAGKHPAAAGGIRKRRKKKRRREETPEATMARLTSSYSAAMEAVGALHRVSRLVWKENCVAPVVTDDNERKSSGNVGEGTIGNEIVDGARLDTGKDDVLNTNSDEMMQVEDEKTKDADNKNDGADKLVESKATIQKVAQSARSSLEQSLLLDPIVLAPILLPSVSSKYARAAKYMAEDHIPIERLTSALWTVRNTDSNKVSKASSVSKWNKLSAAHKSTVKQIAYLSLVNYADLLLCGCDCSCSSTGDILDRRPVKSLDVLKLFHADEDDTQQTTRHCSSCLWEESREETLRIVLASYCDALDLDPSDPTLWFKVACTARALGRILNVNKSASDAWRPSSYRSLERLALERGLNSLPKGVPPNRMLLRAWKEMEVWDKSCCSHVSDESDSVALEEKSNEPIKLVVHLPNDSWSTLGRILIRACKEGAGYGRSGSVSHVWSTNCNAREDYEFGSPLMDLQISPMLCLSRNVICSICSYLGKESNDVKSFACTSKYLASEIRQVLLLFKDDKKNSPDPITTNNPSDVLVSSNALLAEQPVPNINVPIDTPNESNTLHTDVEANNTTASVTTSPKLKRSSSQSPRPVIPGERASKRVRSQMITSEKETERQSKRSSVEYCFLAGGLGCISQHPKYTKLAKAEFDWDQLQVLKSCCSSEARDYVHNAAADKTADSTFDIPSSLIQFVQSTSKNNSGPRHLLELFLVHVAMNTVDVFGTKQSDLSSCFLDCFDQFTRDMTSSVGSDFSWYGKEDLDGLDSKCFLSTLAVNLLAHELRFKRATKQENSYDASSLASSIPALLKFASNLEFCDSQRHKITELRCRCYWLACEYYFWLSRCINASSVSADGERIGMNHLKKALDVLSVEGSNHSRSIQISTPHLQSQHREGRYWSVLSVETLSSYHDERSSSAVVSRARNEFISICQSQGVLSTDQTIKLKSIGTDLLDWYSQGDGTSKGSFEEIAKDFLVHHNEILCKDKPPSSSFSSAREWLGCQYWGEQLWHCIPVSKETSINFLASIGSSRPSIIQVLLCSLYLANENTSSVLNVLAQLTLAALQLHSRNSIVDISEKREDNADMDSHNVTQDEVLLTMANHFMDKTMYLLSCQELNVDFEGTLGVLNDVICTAMNIMSSKRDQYPSNAQFHFFHSISQYMAALRAMKLGRDVEKIYFATLAKMFVAVKNDYKSLSTSDQDKRTKTSQTQLSRTADFISHIANELAECLSLNPTTINSDSKLVMSPVMEALGAKGENKCDDDTPHVKLYESMIWLWHHASKASEKVDVIRVRLLKPLAAAIVALCGAFGISIDSTETGEDEEFGLYFDSDASAHGGFLREDDDENKRILRKLNQLVQCISLVYSKGEKAVCFENAPFMSPSRSNGPLLPLVVIRVLSTISDNIFHLFSQEVWDEEYPFGARTCGEALDKLLSSAYRAVYGISLLGQSQTDTLNDIAHLPESLDAAASLFRCVKRMYRRKALPTRALELIDKVLPAPTETPVSSAIRTFLFDGNKNVSLSQYAEDVPMNFPEWILDDNTDNDAAMESESDRLRKMVSSELAKGSITRLDSNQGTSGDDDSGMSEERELTRSHELSLYNKFRVLIDDLSINPSHVENWVVLSETCGFKADIICDRLVSLKEPFSSSDFRPRSTSMKTRPAELSLDQIKEKQLDEFNESRTNWIPYLGNDLSVYMKHPWSTISSLQSCAEEIKSKLSPENTSECSMMKDLEAMFEEENFVSWTNGWAGMFVLALRRMKVRCLLVARFLAKSNKENRDMHPSDVAEDIGTSLFGDLVGSTTYGFPIKTMTDQEKREIAQCAKFFFEEAVKLSTSDSFSCKSETVLWENEFMIGKCYEKIASTLSEEAYSSQDGQRAYEKTLKSALETYSSALIDAKDRDHSSGKRDTGGSSHGSLEVLYRIHACRLKCLLFSIRRVNEERELAELEALRIVSQVWFGDSPNVLAPSLRHKIWVAFVNCVKALIQCRTDESKFHRAAFRLAQAYNWAPVFHDPSSPGDRKEVLSIDDISLPYIESGSCSKNATSAIECLFDKQKSQLCSVWVTTSSKPPPFEVLNDPVRKYDYLRLKYISAYIDCMKENKQMSKIETLLNNTTTCSQDYAGFYQASAAARGGDPGRHTKQSLLKTSGFLAQVKRLAIDAMAELVLAELAHLKKNGVDANGRAALEAGFKTSISIFLRLNCQPKEAVQHMLSNGPILQIVAMCKCFISIQAGYRINDSIKFEELDGDTLLSFTEQALQKAKVMFPTKSKQQPIKKRVEAPPASNS